MKSIKQLITRTILFLASSALILFLVKENFELSRKIKKYQSAVIETKELMDEFKTKDFYG